MNMAPKKAALGHAKFVHLAGEEPLFAARGRRAAEGARRASAASTACPPSRSPTPTTSSASTRSPTRWRRRACSRSSASPFPSTSKPPAPAHNAMQPRAHPSVGAAGQGRGGLRQSLQADLERLSRCRARRSAACHGRAPRGQFRGPDSADRRSRRSAQPADRRRSAPGRRPAARPAVPMVRRPALCRAAAPRAARTRPRSRRS